MNRICIVKTSLLKGSITVTNNEFGKPDTILQQKKKKTNTQETLLVLPVDSCLCGLNLTKHDNCCGDIENSPKRYLF